MAVEMPNYFKNYLPGFLGQKGLKITNSFK